MTSTGQLAAGALEAADPPTTPIDVCAAVICRGNLFLLATRPSGSHMAGRWEFPGGKTHRGETSEQCIRRELSEELDVRLGKVRRLSSVLHSYPGKTIRLTFLACELATGHEPSGLEGQRVGWFTVEQMERLDLAPADREFLTLLRTEDGLRQSVQADSDRPGD